MDQPFVIALSIVILPIASYVLYRMYMLLFGAYIYKRKAIDLGGGNRRRLKEQIRNKTLPPFPSGWFAAFPSFELKKGQYHEEQIFGEELVFFRNSEGTDQGASAARKNLRAVSFYLIQNTNDLHNLRKVSAFDAYCPHLGAKLTKGGSVNGDCIVCPFHGWEFETNTGRCVKIPDIEDTCIPKNAKLKPWSVIERNGMVLIWNSKNRIPKYGIPEVISANKLVLHGVSKHEIETIPQDLHENGPDMGHLNIVHVKGSLPFISHRFLNASWRPSEDLSTPHLGHVVLTEQATVFGVRMKALNTDIIQHGPGVVLLTFTRGFMILIQALKPVKLGVTVSYHMLYLVPWIPRFVAKIMFNEFLHLYEGDVVIWNNKKFLKNPTFVKTDRAIATFRKWYKQFYEEEEQPSTTQESA